MRVIVVVTKESEVEGVFTDEVRAQEAATLAALAGTGARMIAMEVDERPSDG